MYIIYGIPNCDSVKKARTWLDKHKITYEFHDYKTQGITKAKLNEWCKQLGWENVLNRNSTTLKEMDEAIQQSITSQATAVNLMMEHTSIIKRPIIEKEGKIVAIRFNEPTYHEVFL